MTTFLEDFCSTLKIKAKNRGVIPFTPNWAQSQVIAEVDKAEAEGRPARIIVLKARQLGISTVAEAILFSKAVSEQNSNCVVVAHDGSSSEALFNITKHYYETWPYKSFFKHRYATRRQLTLDANGSNIWVMTSEHTDAGRGRTFHAMHASELGFWGEPEETMNAFNQAMPAIPGTIQILESTANGMGNFFEEEWLAAKAGEKDFVPLFFPWWGHYEYVPCQGEICTDGTCEKCQAMSKGLKPADSEERDLMKMGCDLPHLAWRRWAIPNRCFSSIDMFHQEFPSTDDEAFLVSGVNAFPDQHLKNVYEPMRPEVGSLALGSDGKVRFVPDAAGPLRLYVKPADAKSWGEYFVGADPCFGQDPEKGGDWAAGQVINRQSHEQVAVWHGRINPVAFADELVKLARFYNDAMISVETDGPGYATIGRLSGLYPHIWHHRIVDRLPGKQRSNVSLSWQSNWKRKQWLVSKLAEDIERGNILLHDVKTYKELRGYTFYGQKGYGDVYGPATQTQHDDLVMSLGIAVLCESTEPAVQPYGSQSFADERPGLSDTGQVKGRPLPEEDAYEEWPASV